MSNNDEIVDLNSLVDDSRRDENTVQKGKDILPQSAKDEKRRVDEDRNRQEEMNMQMRDDVYFGDQDQRREETGEEDPNDASELDELQRLAMGGSKIREKPTVYSFGEPSAVEILPRDNIQIDESDGVGFVLLVPKRSSKTKQSSS